MIQLNIIALFFSLFSLLASAYYFCVQGTFVANPYGEPSPDNAVALYGLRDCGYSALKEVQLEKQGLAFRVEYPVEDRDLYGELERRLVEDGYDFDGKALVYHLPVVEVNGKLVASKRMEDIWPLLNYY